MTEDEHCNGYGARWLAAAAKFPVDEWVWDYPGFSDGLKTKIVEYLTGDAVRRCLKAGIPVWLIDGDDAEPRRIGV